MKAIALKGVEIEMIEDDEEGWLLNIIILFYNIILLFILLVFNFLTSKIN